MGLMLLPHRVDRRCVHRAGPAALLRLLRGDDDPALRARRRLGRAGANGRDAEVRPLHDGRFAADARLRSSSTGCRRTRSTSSRSARARATGSSSASSPRSRSRRRSSRSTAGCPTRTASHRRRCAASSRASSRRRPRTASCGSRSRSSPSPTQHYRATDPRARGDRLDLRLAARVSRTGPRAA